MIDDDTLIEREKVHEGFSSTPKPCPSWHLSVGYGHNLEQSGMGKAATSKFLNKDIDKGITTSDAEKLLKHDLETTKKEIIGDKRLGSLFEKLDDERQYVLLDLCFNMGKEKVKGFNKMLTAMENGDYDKASKELLNSRYAKQTGIRARKNAECLRTGVWPNSDPKNNKIKAKMQKDAEKAQNFGEKKQQALQSADTPTKEITIEKTLTEISTKTSNNSEKDKNRMRSMLNNLNKANGKNKQLDVETTIDTFTKLYGNDASKVLTKIMMTPTQFANNLDLRNEDGKPVRSSREIIEQLCKNNNLKKQQQVLNMVIANKHGHNGY